MAGRYKSKLKWSDITPESVYLNRRALLGTGAAAVAGAAFAASAASDDPATDPAPESSPTGDAAGDFVPNSWEDITSYNNFYEFGTGKGDPKRYAGALTTDPWSIVVDGLVERPGTYDIADILKDKAIEERIYRLRCVEGWSMVVPWNGFELKDLLDQVGVLPSAKYVAFETLVRPEEMPGVRYPMIPWPYREGLRLDEAMHPLTLMACGIYGKDIPNQNGAPIRLVVPWKYGFKSIKSIVRVTLTDEEPPASWNMVLPSEYGFYSNVNPEVDHPRWSQATERRIGGGLLSPRVETLIFNGYADEVAAMYAGMNLEKFF